MAKAMGGLDEALSKVGKNVKKAINGEKILHTNEKIISKAAYGALNNGFGAAETVNRMLNKQGFSEALTRTFANDADKLFDSAGKRIAGSKANLNYGKIAGSYIGASAAARVVTGGGLYKDKNGNSNIAGIPFI